MISKFTRNLSRLNNKFSLAPRVNFSSQGKFVPYDYTDALNFKSLLTEEELLVIFKSLETFFNILIIN